MTEINANRAILNLTRAQQTGFREAVNEQGQLVTQAKTSGLKGKLVSLVEQGSVKPGSFAGRVIKAVVGRQNFENISQQLQANRDRSVKNTLNAFIESTTKGLDDDLKQAVADKVWGRLGNSGIKYSTRQFVSLKAAITESVIPKFQAQQELEKHLPASDYRSDADLDVGDKAARRAGQDGEVKSILRQAGEAGAAPADRKSVSFGQAYVREDSTINNVHNDDEIPGSALSLEDITETLDIIDPDAPMVSDKQLARNMRKELLEITESGDSSPEQKAAATDLLNKHPVFEAFGLQ